MTLRQKQSKFAFMFAQLILKAYEMGYEITFGEGYRSPEESLRLSKLGKGIKNSLHSLRLAQDINLFKNGVYLTSTKSHQPLGEWWESQGGTWGGRFNDGNHYSLEHNGVK